MARASVEAAALRRCIALAPTDHRASGRKA
jgi:hypothetical protein